MTLFMNDYQKMKADPARWEKYQARQKRKACRQPKARARKYVEDLAYRLWDNAMRRARKRGIEFTIKVADVVVPTHCPILGCELKPAIGANAPSANSPSLDRIDCRYGYVKGNILVMSFRANTLKNNATAAELQKVAAWLAENEF